jgi:type II secretory pathway pseudopilin PulG
MMKKTINKPGINHNEAGFTLIETAISGVILMVGLIALLGVFTLAISTTQGVQIDQIAKQKAMDTLESIYTARSTQQLTFAQIANIGPPPATGIFTATTVNGILTDGPDGLAGTADDGTTPMGTCPLPYQCEIVPGPDGLMSDPVTVQLNNFTRTIAITQPTADANLKQVVVTIGYADGHGHQKTYVAQALISAFR